MTASPTIHRVCAQDATVTRTHTLCRDHVQIDFALPDFPPSRPGQFLQVRCAPPRAERPPRTFEWSDGQPPSLPELAAIGRAPLLRRPFSIADRVDENKRVVLSVISRSVGRGTTWLEALQPGDKLNITGPLGNGFRIPAPETPLALVGGGVGIPPLLYLARVLHARGHKRVVLIFGATSGDLLPVPLHAEPDAHGAPRHCVQLPGDAPFPAIVTTDDASLGLGGRVTDALARLHERAPATLAGGQVLACGPEPMLVAIARLTRELNVACQVCLERFMACGVGTCLSCVVRTFDPATERGWRWRLACQDGPVFDRDAVVDYA